MITERAEAEEEVCHLFFIFLLLSSSAKLLAGITATEKENQEGVDGTHSGRTDGIASTTSFAPTVRNKRCHDAGFLQAAEPTRTSTT
jgi:hypothetical protein